MRCSELIKLMDNKSEFYYSFIIIAMQKGQNLFYRWEVLENISDFLTLKDLLATAALSKQYNHMLRKYIKEHYSLTINANQSEFQQLKDLLHRRISIYSKGSKYSKLHPQHLILRQLQPQTELATISTVDSVTKLIKTPKLLQGEELEYLPLPQKMQVVRVAQNNSLYCYDNKRILKYKYNPGGLQEPEILEIKGEVQDIVVGFKHAIAIVREKPDEVILRIFDYLDPLTKFKDAELPVQLISLTAKDNFLVSKAVAYFVYNQALYELNLKTASAYLHPEFTGKKIMKIKGGKLHFFAYERVQELSNQWSTEDVIKFAHTEGFEDFIKIFKQQKVTGKVLLEMDKKYMEEVLGIVNQKMQQKLTLKIAEQNTENPQNYVIYGWGRASEGALGTNPSKQITKPIKVKLPNDCEILDAAGLYTIIVNKKVGLTYVNSIEQKTNKQEWKQICSKKVWSVSAVDEHIILIVSASKERVPQRQSEAVLAEKKEKLRTAKNIIDKITWDPHINSQEFRIGFLDKFEGILQIPFKELDNSEIKEYRIEYFKRGKEVVWDKKKRIDIL